MPDERHPVTGAPVLLVADGGLQQPLPPGADPIAEWFELMEVLEMLSEGREPVGRGDRRGWVYRL